MNSYGLGLFRCGRVSEATTFLEKVGRGVSMGVHTQAHYGWNCLGDVLMTQCLALSGILDRVAGQIPTLLLHIPALKEVPSFAASAARFGKGGLEKACTAEELKVYHKHFDEPFPRDLDRANRVVLEAWAGSISAYKHYFLASGSFEPLMRIVSMYAKEKANLFEVRRTAIERGLHGGAGEHPAQVQAMLPQALRRLASNGRLLGDLIEQHLELARLAVEREGGEESLDYWTHSSALEIAVFGVTNVGRGAPGLELFSRLASMLAVARGPHQIGITLLRVQRHQECLLAEAGAAAGSGGAGAGAGSGGGGGGTAGKEGSRPAAAATAAAPSHAKHPLLRETSIASATTAAGLLEEMMEFLALARDELERKGQTSETLLKVKRRLAAVRRMQEAFAPGLACGAAELQKATAFFLRKTFNFRGLVGAPRPQFVPGGFDFGGRVFDIIITHKDYSVLQDLLKIWGLDETRDVQTFLRGIIRKVRRCLGTHELQNLMSDTHKKFDAASNAAIELSGCPEELRRGTRSTSNISAALMFFGDCREHCSIMLAFFAVWQKRRVHALLLEAAALIGKEASEQRERFSELVHLQIPGILRTQLRGAHVGVHAPVRMDSVYKPSGCDASGVRKPLHRRYGIDEWRQKEALSDYELANSFVEATFADGSTQVIDQKKDPDTKKWVIPNVGGVPALPETRNGYPLVAVGLFNLVENHTMTFLVRERQPGSFSDSWVAAAPGLGKNLTVTPCDSFYSRTFDSADAGVTEQSPYEFFSEEPVSLEDVLARGGLDGGTMAVHPSADRTDECIDVPVRLALKPYSGRSQVRSR